MARPRPRRASFISRFHHAPASPHTLLASRRHVRGPIMRTRIHTGRSCIHSCSFINTTYNARAKIQGLRARDASSGTATRARVHRQAHPSCRHIDIALLHTSRGGRSACHCHDNAVRGRPARAPRLDGAGRTSHRGMQEATRRDAGAPGSRARPSSPQGRGATATQDAVAECRMRT